MAREENLDMASAFRVEFDLEKELYRLVGPGGEEGDVIGIGLPAEVEVGGRRYIAFSDWNPDDPNEPEPTIELPVHLLGQEQRQVVDMDLDFTGLDGVEEGGEDGAAPVEVEAGIEADDDEDEPVDGQKDEGTK
jgi:hypothetical protein